MKLSVYVLGREVAVLESAGDFKSVLTYLPNTVADDFVSLTMPVRTESWVWDDQLPPVFQMNLPEGYLLQVLQEQFGMLSSSTAFMWMTKGSRSGGWKISVLCWAFVLRRSMRPHGSESRAPFAITYRAIASNTKPSRIWRQSCC
jgi:HipA-like protein